MKGRKGILNPFSKNPDGKATGIRKYNRTLEHSKGPGFNPRYGYAMNPHSNSGTTIWACYLKMPAIIFFAQAQIN